MFPGIRLQRFATFHVVFHLLTLTAVRGQECADTVIVGSLSHNDSIVFADQTFILANHTVPCDATVVAWEFCYQVILQSNATSAIFYPGIWRNTQTNRDNAYTLVQSNTVTYDPRGVATNLRPCGIFNLSDSDQFTAPAGSVIGLYSNVRTQLLHTKTDRSITTYRSSRNQSSVTIPDIMDANYNIAIKVHLVVPTSSTTTSPNNTTTTTTSMASPSITTTYTTTATSASMASTRVSDAVTASPDPVSTSDTTTVTPTTSIVSISDTTTVTPTTSIVSTSDTTTVTPTTSLVSTSDATTTDSSVATDARSDNDSGGGSSIGIIVGAVIGVILCIIVISVVVILLWCYSRQRKDTLQVTQNLELIADKRGLSQESTAIDDSSNYSAILQNQPNVKHNNNVGYKNVVSKHEAPSYKNIKGSNDMSLLSKDSTGKSYSRFESNDYESPPNLAGYGTAIQLYSNTTRASTAYNNSIISEYSEITDATDEEEIYSDPGHSKEDIYACFEKKKFRMIKRNDVSILQTLGSGEFGVVNLGLWSNVCADPVQVAVKTLNSQCSESDRVKFLREAAIMGQFKHNNVVQLHGVVFEEENAMIVLEYMLKGDLREFLIDLKNTTPPKKFNELKHDLLSYCRHVSAGLSHLASKGFVHRDLAARNILVSSDDVCKIADFGMARDVTDDTYYVSSGGKIPVKWTAPEAIFYKKYSVQSDVWSFGCVMYEIWSLGYKPFEDLDTTEYIKKITTGYRLPPPPGCPRAIYELMIKCWHPVANQRINSCLIFKALQQSDRALLPGTISAKDNEELSTGLGDPLTTSSNLYQDLQNTYLSTINN